jgi:hypothetical protein
LPLSAGDYSFDSSFSKLSNTGFKEVELNRCFILLLRRSDKSIDSVGSIKDANLSLGETSFSTFNLKTLFAGLILGVTATFVLGMLKLENLL